MNLLQRPPVHTRRDHVLPADEHAALLDWALANEATLSDSRVGKGQVSGESRRARSFYGSAEWKRTSVAHIDALLPGILADLGMAYFRRDGFEIEMVVYGDGGHIRPHHDTATGLSRHPHDRVVTIVYHFHREPQGYSGGTLRLLAKMPGADGKRAYVDLEPRQNGLIAFPSLAIHEVLPVSVPSGRFEDSRFGINFWAQRHYRDPAEAPGAVAADPIRAGGAQDQ